MREDVNEDAEVRGFTFAEDSVVDVGFAGSGESPRLNGRLVVRGGEYAGLGIILSARCKRAESLYIHVFISFEESN